MSWDRLLLGQKKSKGAGRVQQWPSPLVVEQEVHSSDRWALQLHDIAQGCIIILL